MSQKLIIGCGYIGFPVATEWLRLGHAVHVLTRNAERADALAELGFQPLIGDITEAQTVADLPEADTLLFAVGMDRSRYDSIHDVYVEGLKNVLGGLRDSLQQILYVSSTGVFGNENETLDGQWIDETVEPRPSRDGGKAHLAAENLLRDSRFGSRTTILRLAGIYGPERVPVLSAIREARFERFAKMNVMGYLNLIHQSDAVRAICAIHDARILNELFHVADGQPPIRRDYYDEIARQCDLLPLPWSEILKDRDTEGVSRGKRIRSDKLSTVMNFSFQFPSYKTGLRHALGNLEKK